MQDYKSILEEEKFYHIYNRANGNETLFYNNENFRFFLQQYNYYISPIANTLAYCLMPNHFHFLVRIKNLTGLEDLSDLEKAIYYSKQFSNLFNSYTKAFNKANNRKGNLFSRPFNRKEITNEPYLRNAINYIHQNPVSHNFVTMPDEWSYSSYTAITNDKPTKIDKGFILSLFDDKENFIIYHNEKNIEKYALDMNISY